MGTNLRSQMRRHLAFGNGPDRTRLIDMLREGACVVECRLGFPELSEQAIRRMAHDAGYYPGAVPSLTGQHLRPWTPTEIDQVAENVSRRTADQIRYAVMPWRSAAEIRLKVRELGLKWGAAPPIGQQVVAHEEPAPRGRRKQVKKIPMVAALATPAWTRDQDTMLAMQAGLLPVVVLRERLALLGPRWGRAEIRDRLRLLTERGRVAPGRSLVLRRLEKDAQRLVENVAKRGATLEEAAVALGRGYTPAMLRKTIGAPLAPATLPLAKRGGRNAPEGLERLRQRLAYPTDRAAVLTAFQECRWQVSAWARLRGFRPREVRTVLNSARTCRGTALEIARGLGLQPPPKSMLPPEQLKFSYPTTPEQVRQAFRDHGITMSTWATAHGFKPAAVSVLLTGYYQGVRGKSLDVAEALGLRPAASSARKAARDLVFPYPTDVKAVRRALADNRVTVDAWAQAHGFATQTVSSVLTGHSKATKGAAREVAVLLGFVPAEPTTKSASEIHFHYPTTDTQVRATLNANQVTVADWARANGLTPAAVVRVLGGRGRGTVEYVRISRRLGFMPATAPTQDVYRARQAPKATTVVAP